MSERASEEGARRLPPPVLALTPGTLRRSVSGSSERLMTLMERAAAAAIEGGVRGLLVREPSLEDGAFLELALRLRDRLDAAGGGWLGLHDRLHLVEAVDADGGHVGGRSLPLPEARLVLGEDRVLGASSHEGDESESWEGADYLLHAPVFQPTSKLMHGREALGWSAAEDFATAAEPPVYALGGVTVERLQEILRERSGGGAPSALVGVALIGGLWGTSPGRSEGAGNRPPDVPRELEDLLEIGRRALDLTTAAGALFRLRDSGEEGER